MTKDDIDYEYAHGVVCAELSKAKAEIERLRAQWHDSDPEKFYLENKALRAKVERLRAALETCEAWIDRWTAHVGTCKGDCTCGRTAVLFEARAALIGKRVGGVESKA